MVTPTTARSTQLLGGTSRFVLSTAGHIAGIVNPPNPKAKHWTNESGTTDPDEWIEGATLHNETWWQDWIKWVNAHGGEKVKALKPGSDAYPALCAAPGTYVHIKA